MSMMKKLAILGIAGLALGATACGSKTEETAATTTSAAPASTTTTAKESSSTTAKTSTPKVTKPVRVEKIDKSSLPASTPSVPSGFDISADEQDCVDTVIYEYASDPSNATDDATLAGVAGGAIAVCVDQDKIAVAIVTSIQDAAPEVTDEQAGCLANEIASTDTDSLAIFLGAFLYSGEGSTELQAPFIEALGQACGLPTS